MREYTPDTRLLLKPCDIIIVRRTGFLSSLLRFFTPKFGEKRTRADGVGVIVESGTMHTAAVVEALSTVKLHAMARYRGRRRTAVAVFRPETLTSNEKAAIVAKAKSYVDCVYGYAVFMAHWLDWLLHGAYFFRRFTNQDAYPICSWLVAHAHMAAGKDFGVVPGQANPDDIWDFVATNPDRYRQIRDLTPVPREFSPSEDIRVKTDDMLIDQMQQMLWEVMAEVGGEEPGIKQDDLIDAGRRLMRGRQRKLLPDYEELVAASDRVSQLNESRLTVLGRFVRGIGLLVWVAMLAILFVKLLGGLEGWSYRPWLVAFGFLVLASWVIGAVDSRRALSCQVSFEEKKRRFREQLLQIVESARSGLRTASWSDPESDDVRFASSAGLGARIGGTKRVLTEAYLRVRSHLMRETGCVVGLSGPRGAGKTELLREFCELPEGASIRNGGTIGVMLSAPRAFPPEAFISLIIRKLSEQVPGYADPWTMPSPRALLRDRRVAPWLVALAAIGIGFYLVDPSLFGATSLGRRTVGRLLIGLGFALAALLAVIGVRRAQQTGTMSIAPRLFGYLHGLGREAAQLERRKVAVHARQTAQRMRFVETQTATGEASAGVAGLSARVGHQTQLRQIPLSEADLVDEFAQLVGRLRTAGYRLVVGIDELDKLETDEAGEEFLNGLKAIFSVSGCSFLVSVSESAWGKFAQRGILIRDTFDSSLDSIVILAPPTLAQARAFLRLRESRLTDTQVLFCYCLSGGIPRDLLRAARRLGEVNEALPGETNPLDIVAGRVLAEEATTTIDAALLNARALPAEVGIAQYQRGLELMRDRGKREQRLKDCLVGADPVFEALINEETNSDADQRPSRSTGGRPPERRLTLREQERRTVTYLLFLEALHKAISSPGLVAGLPTKLDRAGGKLESFLKLAEARRRLETSPVSSWPLLEEACDELGLACKGRDASEDTRLHQPRERDSVPDEADIKESV